MLIFLLGITCYEMFYICKKLLTFSICYFLPTKYFSTVFASDFGRGIASHGQTALGLVFDLGFIDGGTPTALSDTKYPERNWRNLCVSVALIQRSALGRCYQRTPYGVQRYESEAGPIHLPGVTVPGAGSPSGVNYQVWHGEDTL